MSRQAREKSRSGIYHVVSRGINRQDIFNDEEDLKRYLEILGKVKQNRGVEVHGYCLMGNHVHLLIKEGREGIAAAMKSVGTGYARWYNWKYNRVGHVFQDRYRSETVDDEAYLFTVIRYIHLNPMKADLVKKPESWRWSSCRAYYDMQHYPPGLTETALILGILSKDKGEAISIFKKYMEEANSDKCLDHDEVKRKTDAELREEILQLMQGHPIQSIYNMTKEERNNILRAAKNIEGTTYRQLARIFGISTSAIFNA